MNLVHRDVSPQNILLSRDGHVRLSDFGIAKAMSGIRELSSIMRVQGKVSYLSPEQARNEPLDRRSDVFSLGVVLYLAALGRRPFAGPGERDERAIARLLSGELTHPLQVEPSFSPALAEIIVRALQNDPARRYATAADMRHDLELWLSTSGPLISEQEVAVELHARCGQAIEHQQILIRAALSWDEEAHPKEPSVPPSSRRTLTHESGTFPSAALQERPTAPLGPEPRVTRLSWAARALGAGALGLGAALVWLVPDRHHEGAPAPVLQHPVASASPHASSSPTGAEAVTPAQGAAPVTIAPAVDPRSLPTVPRVEPKARATHPRPQPAPTRQVRSRLGPVERDL